MDLQILMKFFRDQKARTICYSLYDSDNPRGGFLPDWVIAPPLYYVSREGLSRRVKLLLDKGADANPQGGWYGSALNAASFNAIRIADFHYSRYRPGSKEVIQTLLNAGVDVNEQDEYYGNALNAASLETIDKLYKNEELDDAMLHRSEEVIQMPLDAGANVNAAGKYHELKLRIQKAGQDV